MAKTKVHKLRFGLIVLIFIGLAADFALLLMFLLQGKNIAILNPKGFIAEQQLQLIIFTVMLFLAAAVPTLLLLYFTAWKYRSTNLKVAHRPSGKASKPLVIGMWVVPTIFMLILASVMIPSTHKLVPQEVIKHDKKPITIQVVSMNWKWLFIYPEQKIATVNFVQIPVDTPITFEMTADESPMSSFWIPNLGGQLYSMTTHVNRLNLIAESTGDYPGNSAEINGHGFAGMKFIARASTDAEFNDWVKQVKRTPNILDSDEYDKLLVPSEDHPVTIYSKADNNLFAKVIQKYYEPQVSKKDHE